jgi:hypothetical protein
MVKITAPNKPMKKETWGGGNVPVRGTEVLTAKIGGEAPVRGGGNVPVSERVSAPALRS